MVEEAPNMPGPDHPGSRPDRAASARSGEHTIIREIVAKAVVEAIARQQVGTPAAPLACPPACNYKEDINELRKDIKESFKELREDLRGEIRTVRTDVAQDMQSMRSDLSSIRGDLEDGTLEFRQLNSRLELIERQQKRGTTSSMHPAIRSRSEAPTVIVPAVKAHPVEDPEEKPLISPKVWNALILGLVGTIGAGIGALVVARMGLPPGDDKPEPKTVQAIPAPVPALPAPKVATTP
jgi:hypothetical protein